MAAKSDYFTVFNGSYLLDDTKIGQSVRYIPDILVDADALVALAKSDDLNHQKALSMAGALQKKGCTWCISPFTVGEAVTVISYKVNQAAAQKVLKELREQDLNVLTLKEEHLHLVDQWFNKQRQKGTSYFDCYNMALLERYHSQLNAIFSFDGVYKRNGFKLAEEIVG